MEDGMTKHCIFWKKKENRREALKDNMSNSASLYVKILIILLFQEKSHHFLMQLPIWLIPHRKIDPSLLIDNALIM